MERVYPKEVIGILVSNNYLLFDQYPSDYYIFSGKTYNFIYHVNFIFAEYGVSYGNTRGYSNNADNTVNPTKKDIEEIRCADHDQPRLGYIKPSGKKVSLTSSYTSKLSSPYSTKKKLAYSTPIYGSSISTTYESGSVNSYGFPIERQGENDFHNNRINKRLTSDGDLGFVQIHQY